jgi:hypothetical protein
MLRTRLLRSFAAIAGALIIASCSDSSPVAPSNATAFDNSANLLGGLTGPLLNPSELQLKAVPWSSQRESSITVSKAIGPAGGVIAIPATGLTVVVPPGAVDRSITISITADPKYVAYTMEPAGTHFLRDIVVTQLLNPTSIFGQPLNNQLYAAYIADDNSDLGGVLSVQELEPSRTIFSVLSPLLPVAQVWLVRHFSKYILASG